MKIINKPDKNGYFGPFGGRFVPETLVNPLVELTKSFQIANRTKKFKNELKNLLSSYAGRPTPLLFANRLSEKLKGPIIYLKREDLCHTGAHKINNTLGQTLLAKKMGKKRIIAETGAGQHGVATATAAALLKLKCDVYMGTEDMRRQSLNVFRMKTLGARVIPVHSGSKTLKDAINEALRDWVTNVQDTFYVIGSAVGPHPYPLIVREFQSVIGRESRQQILDQTQQLPHYLMACVGGGSNAIGLFSPFFNDKSVKMIGVEAGGKGLNTPNHAASLCMGTIGILHGAKTYVLQSSEGQIMTTHSVSAGLDYPAVGPEHAYYKWINRAVYVSALDKDGLKGFHLLSETEGILPALEPAHAIGYLSNNAKKFKGKTIIICLSGRGDKDVQEVEKCLKIN